MLNLIYFYVKKIIFYLIFSSFIQILFLNNKFKNYLQLVLNLILIFIMLEPIFNVFNYMKKGELDEFVEITEDFNIYYDYYANVENKLILDLLTENIKNETARLIGDDYTILDFNLTLAEDYNYQTIIKEVHISLAKGGDRLVYVKPFNYDEENEDYEEEIKNIKYIISNFYNLPKENIFISIM